MEKKLLRLKEQKRPRFTTTAIDNFLVRDFKVKPCPFAAGCKQGAANCPFLHPGEKGRRDLRRFLYSADLCPYYNPDGGSCPKGDACSFAHSVLERRLHPSRYSLKTRGILGLRDYLEVEDMLDHCGKPLPHRADAERDAFQLILGLNEGNGLICRFETFFIPLCGASVPVLFCDFIGNDLTMARTATDGIRDHYLTMARTATDGIRDHYSCTDSVTGVTFIFKNDFTLKKNVQPILVPTTSGCSGPQQHLCNNFYNGSNKVFFNHNKDIAVTPAEKRVEPLWVQPYLLSTVNAPPITGGRSAPKDPNSGRIRRPLIFDSGASVHVVGDRWMLQCYQDLDEPWQIAVADGHPLVVVGIGIISQDGFIIPNVFHVLGLKMNLISVSQLDRDHGLFSGFHDGICEVQKRGGDVIGGGFLLANGLYVLSFLQVPEN